MRRTSAEGITKHDDRRSHGQRKRRRCCAAGRRSRAGEGPLEEGYQPEESRAQEPEGRQGQAPVATPKKEPKSNKKAAKPAHAKKTGTPRADSKGSKIMALIGRPKGATLAEIMTATGWQAHSVRGFISGALGKKMGLAVESTKGTAGERTYR